MLIASLDPMKPALTPLDASWIRALDKQSARIDACLPALIALVAIVRAAKTHLVRPEQEPARKAAVQAFERLEWTTFARDGVTLRRGPAKSRGVRKTPAEVTRDVRARRRAKGLCEECGERKPARKKLRGEGPAKRCRECLNFERERVGRIRAGATA